MEIINCHEFLPENVKSINIQQICSKNIDMTEILSLLIDKFIVQIYFQI